MNMHLGLIALLLCAACGGTDGIGQGEDSPLRGLVEPAADGPVAGVPARPVTIAGAAFDNLRHLDTVVWVAQDGTVRQRASIEAPTEVVPGLTGIRSVAVGFAVAEDDSLYAWDVAVTPPAPVKLLDGILEAAAEFGAFALTRSGRVVDLENALDPSFDRQSPPLLEGLDNVVRVRESGALVNLANNLGRYVRSTRYLLQRDGTVVLQETITYPESPSLDTSKTSVVARGAVDVASSGFVQLADGRVIGEGAFVQDLPARKMASTAREARDFNTTTRSYSSTTYLLFDDGALWATTLSGESGETRQGVPTSKLEATQRPVRLPGGIDVTDFAIVGPRALVFGADGKQYVASRVADEATLLETPIEDLRR